MLRHTAVTVAILLAMPSLAAAADNIWLSSMSTAAVGSDFPASLAAVTNFQPYIGGVGKIYIWGWPEAGQSLVDLSLNLVAETQPICSPTCVVPNAISFTSVTIYNPTFGAPSVKRFEYVDDSTGASPLPLSTTRIDGMEGLRIFEGGAVPPVGIGNATDPLHDATHDSWLIAEVTYNVLVTGENSETRLFLEIGPIGMNHAADTTNDTWVVFGDATDAPLNAHDNRGVHSSNIDAYIHPLVLPGDADRNGAVGQSDYTVWRTNFNSVAILTADHNHNGTVDAADYVIWRNNLGQTAGFGVAIVVPEPSVSGLICAIAIALLLFLRSAKMGWGR